MFNKIFSYKKNLQPMTLTWKLWMKIVMTIREETRINKPKSKASATIPLNLIMTILIPIIQKDIIIWKTARIHSIIVKSQIQTRKRKHLNWFTFLVIRKKFKKLILSHQISIFNFFLLFYYFILWFVFFFLKLINQFFQRKRIYLWSSSSTQFIILSSQNL